MYGRIFPEVANLVAMSDKTTRNSLRLFVWLEPFIKNGNKLNGMEAEALESWMDSQGVDKQTESIQLVQFDYKQASQLFGENNKTEAKRCVKNLIEAGILERIMQGKKAHSGLYVLCPDRYTFKCVPNDKPDEYTSKCVPNDKPDRYTSGSEWVHNQGGIGTHDKSTTCDDATYPNTYPLNNPGDAFLSAMESAEKTPITCPECGNRDIVIIANVAICNSCNIAWSTSSRTPTPLQ